MVQSYSREVGLEPARSALLIIDLQNYTGGPDGGEYVGWPREKLEKERRYYFDRLSQIVLPNVRRLQEACRGTGIEVIFTVIESLTQDGRDRSLDYKITGFHVPRGSWDAQVTDEIAPVGDEIVLPKTASSVFNSTNIDYLLRNLEVRYLIVTGALTDQCVESAVRDACDLGYLVTLVSDACATHSEERHINSIKTIKGYCRQRTTDELLAEIEDVSARQRTRAKG